MQQGDQYSIQVSLTKGDQPLAPADVEGVKVMLGPIIARYPDGGLTYDDDNDVWLFPVTQEQTLELRGRVAAQVQVDFGGTPRQIISSKVQQVLVDTSIIRSAWND